MKCIEWWLADISILTELVYFSLHGDEVPSFVCGESDALELIVNLNVFSPLVFLPGQTNKNIYPLRPNWQIFMTRFISTGWHGKLKLSVNFSHLFPYSFDRLVDQSISLLFQFTPLCQRVGLRGLRAHPVELLEAEGSVRLVTLDISLHWVFILSSQIWRFRAQWWLRLFRDFVFTVLLFRKCLGSQEQVVYSQDVTEPVTHIKQNFRTTKSLAGLCCLWLL